MTRPVTLAVIGCGDVATQRYLPTIHANPAVRLAAVCDTVAQRAENAAARFGADRAVINPGAIFADEAVDAVVIATPPWVTPALTVAALRAGKDVLCEKMALALAEAQAVREAERQTGRFVQVGFVLRHGPMFGTLRRWIADDRLGSPLSLRVGIFDESYDPESDPEHYQRIMATLAHGALITFAGGHEAWVEIGWFLPTFPPGEWNIIGPNGMAAFDQAGGEVMLERGSGTERVALDEAWIPSCFQHQIETFVQAMRARTPPEPGSRTGIESLALRLAFERALDPPLTVHEVAYA